MLGATISAGLSTAAFAQSVGPSTTTEPYLLPAAPGVRTMSLLTVGDAVRGYRLVGIPDGMGAWNADREAFNLVISHEISKTLGVPRAHGSKGAFVSRWRVNARTGEVLAGRDHHSAPADVFTWNGGSYVQGSIAYDRFCSGDLAPRSAYFAKSWFGRFGTKSRIFLSGEETSPPFAADHGRVFAHIVSGPDKNESYELPRMGKMAFENALASPYPQPRTVVMLMDDAGRETNVTTANVCRSQGQSGCIEPPSELYMYVGFKMRDASGRHDDRDDRDDREQDKRRPGEPKEIERAGLTNGSFFGVRVRTPAGVVTGENKDFVFSSFAPAIANARFETVNFGDVSNKTGVQIEDESITRQVTQFIRIEDGAWDPRPGKERDFYFVTTGRLSPDPAVWRPSRLWRLRFDDILRPELGGSIEMLLSSKFYPGAGTTPDDDPGFQMFDNMTIDGFGRIILQEDVGGNNRLGRIYVYGVDSRKLERVAAHNPKFFGGDAATNPNFLTNDEESSGVIDVSDMVGPGWYVVNTQVHKASSDPELVEGGQLLGLYIDPSIAR
jgi:hypothetical protein